MRYLKKKLLKIRTRFKIIIICCMISAVLIFMNLPVFLLNFNKALKVENNLKFNSLSLHTSNSNILWNYTTGGDMISISLSSDGNYIVAGSSDNKVYLFDKLSSTPLWVYSTEGDVISVSISSDGNYIVVGSNDHKIYLFDKSSPTPLWNCNAGDEILSVAISSDGNYIVAGSQDNKIYLFNKTNSVPMWNYSTQNIVKSVSISSDGNYIVAGSKDNKVYLFNKLDPIPLWVQLTGGEVGSVSISSDGKYIASISDWKIVFIYVYSSNELIFFSDSGNLDKDGSFELIWVPFKGADNYSIYYYHSLITKINSSITLLESGIKTNHYFVHGLIEGDYYFIIIAYNSSGSYFSNNVYVEIRVDTHYNDFIYQIILLILFFSIISIFFFGVVYVAKRKSRYYQFESFKVSSSSIMDDLLAEMPEFRAYLNSNISCKKIPLIKEIPLTFLSPEELNKIDLIDLSIEEKKLFIKEILSLDIEERKKLIDEILDTGNK